jgi:hypothetical protein
MSFALNFNLKLKQYLKGLAPEYDWEPEWRADAPSRVDVAGLKANVPQVLVKVELKKDNPVENVVKIWRWATKERKTNRILFLHAFSAHYHSDAPSSRRPAKVKQYERAVFIGEQMTRDRNVPLKYKPLQIRSTTRGGQPIPFKPRMRRGSVTKEGGAAMHRAARHLALTIANLLHPKAHR